MGEICPQKAINYIYCREHDEDKSEASKAYHTEWYNSGIHGQVRTYSQLIWRYEWQMVFQEWMDVDHYRHTLGQNGLMFEGECNLANYGVSPDFYAEWIAHCRDYRFMK